MIERTPPELSVGAQCRLLSISRSSFYYELMGETAMNLDLMVMIDKLANRLKEQPDNAEGWVMLGRSYTVVGQHADALKAYERAVALRPTDAQVLADYADSMAVNNNMSLAGEPMKWVAKALQADPNNLKALALAGTDAFMRKDYAGAVKYWQRLVDVGPPDSDYVREIAGGLKEARALGGLPADAKTTAQTAPVSANSQPALTGKTVSGVAVSYTHLTLPTNREV